MELTLIQKDIITALINLQRQKDRAIKGEEIAEEIQRNPGTIRNQMQLLKALSLVEGVPGPKGGYKPTGAAYEALNIDQLKNESVVPIFRNDLIVNGATAAEISFTTVRSPEKCSGVIRILGSTKDFVMEDKIQVGPTPVNRLIIRGKVTGRDDTNNSILFDINEMISLPKKQVKHYMKYPPVLINVNASIQEATRVLIRNSIHGAPVEDKETVVGIVTYTDIGHAIAQGKVNLKVKDLMTKELITVDGDMQLYDVVKLFHKYNVSRLVVTINGVAKGTLSKTDVLNELAIY
ncbi:MAG: CBS domain-containing protein [Methanosarcinaceae archaeon]|nr:CBS domain-containing protein [Methanosarcinaceae archaeon]MDD4332048.1 CBS domain-containing protein [Methanosarcinaceae archaeon]MDD4749550.1 CBS domain-containing protein [Methanosarcinaceae archaeon]